MDHESRPRDLAGARIHVIVNPRAGRVPSHSRLSATLEAVAVRYGLEPLVAYTEAPGHATRLARRAVEQGCRAVIAVGGDGTLNEVINGVAASDVAVGLIPAGTANVWAREAGVPRDPLAALTAQFNAPVVPLDLGVVRRGGGDPAERAFLLMASYGVDAEAVRVVRPGLKRWVRGGAYLWAGLSAGLRYPGFHVRLDFDAGPPEEVESALLVIGNTREYAGITQFTREASAVDGALDVVAFRGAGLRAMLRPLPMALLRRHLRSDRVLYRRARSVTLTPLDGRPLPTLQIDGDLGPPGADTITLRPGALQMFVPCAARPLFQPPTQGPPLPG